MRKAALLVLTAALLAGCGGGSKSAATGAGAAGAGVAPKSTAFLLRLDTSFESEQWKAFESLLRMFPGGEKAFEDLGGSGTTLDDLKAALGPETDVIALNRSDLDNEGFVGLTQSDDEAKLQTLLSQDTSTPPVNEEIAGWQAIADDRATLDRLKAARNDGTLSGNASYTESIDSLPPESIASLYIDGGVLTQAIGQRAKTGSGPIPGLGRIGWLSAALSAHEKSMVFDLALKGDEIEAAPYTPDLLDVVPANVSVFLDFKGLDKLLDELRNSPAAQKQLGGSANAIGPLLDELIELFKGEAAFYVRGTGSRPEATFVLEVSDEAGAKQTLDKFATLAGAQAQATPEAVRIGRFSVQKLTIENSTVYYGVLDGKIVVTSAREGISGLSTARHLADSPSWRSAVEAARLPDQTAGIFFADVQELVNLGKRFSTSKSAITPEAEQAADRLGTILVHGAVTDGVASLKGLVSVR